MTAWAAIDPDGPALAIGCAKSEHHLCLQIPGCNFRKADGIWRAPLHWATYVAFKTVWSLQPISEASALLDWAAGQWQEVQERYAMRGTLDAPEPWRSMLLQLDDGAQKLTLPQRGGAAWLAHWGRVGLEDPTGNGKTPQIIRALQLLRDHRGGALPALVIAPGAALYGWRDKLAAWAPEMSVSVISGTASVRRKSLLTEADVYLIGWATVRYHSRLARYPGQEFVKCDSHGGSTQKTVSQCEMCPKELNTIPFQTVVADEAHRMQDARSKWTRAVWWLAQNAPYFWPVTGTLVSDTIASVWPILHGLDPRGAPSRSRYLDLFAVKNLLWNGGAEFLDIRPDTAAAFHAIVQPLFRRVPREIARPHQPPRLEPEFRYPEMSPVQTRTYRQLRKDLLADIGVQTLVPASAVVKFGRLCQLAAAAVELTDGEDRDGFTRQLVKLALPSNKVDDLLEFLSDNPGPLVVAANTPALIELCEYRLAHHQITFCKIVGGMSAEAKYQAAQEFQRGESRVIFITAAGGEAIDLQTASTIYFIQPDPSYLATEQKIGRVDRFGQTSAVRIVYSISPGTVEERLYSLSREKAERSQNVSRDGDLMRWIVGERSDRGLEIAYPAE